MQSFNNSTKFIRNPNIGHQSCHNESKIKRTSNIKEIAAKSHHNKLFTMLKLITRLRSIILLTNPSKLKILHIGHYNTFKLIVKSWNTDMYVLIYLLSLFCCNSKKKRWNKKNVKETSGKKINKLFMDF